MSLLLAEMGWPEAVAAIGIALAGVLQDYLRRRATRERDAVVEATRRHVDKETRERIGKAAGEIGGSALTRRFNKEDIK